MRIQLHQRRATAHEAAATPRAVPANDSNNDSVTNWRTMRIRDAPSAVRIAISRLRPAPRAKQQVRDVHAGDQQHQPHGSKQNNHGRTRITDQASNCGRTDASRTAGVSVRMLLPKRVHDVRAYPAAPARVIRPVSTVPPGEGSALRAVQCWAYHQVCPLRRRVAMLTQRSRGLAADRKLKSFWHHTRQWCTDALPDSRSSPGCCDRLGTGCATCGRSGSPRGYRASLRPAERFCPNCGCTPSASKKPVVTTLASTCMGSPTPVSVSSLV